MRIEFYLSFASKQQLQTLPGWDMKTKWSGPSLMGPSARLGRPWTNMAAANRQCFCQPSRKPIQSGGSSTAWIRDVLSALLTRFVISTQLQSVASTLGPADHVLTMGSAGPDHTRGPRWETGSGGFSICSSWRLLLQKWKTIRNCNIKSFYQFWGMPNNIVVFCSVYFDSIPNLLDHKNERKTHARTHAQTHCFDYSESYRNWSRQYKQGCVYTVCVCTHLASWKILLRVQYYLKF